MTTHETGEHDARPAPHHHIDEQGFLVKCYHTCKSFVKMPSFWIAQTLLFPLEHFLWTKAPVFSHIAEWLGLISH